MKRFYLCLLLCLCCVVCMAQKGDWKKYPYVETKKASNGKYGIPDGKGGWKVQPLFDFLLFGGGEPVGVAEYKGKYHIVDRNLNVISKTATCSRIPTVTPYCVILNNGEQGSYAINFKGERISPVYKELTMYLSPASKDQLRDYIFFAKEKDDKEYSLLGLDFKKIVKYGFSSSILLTEFVDDRRNGEQNLIHPLIEFEDSNGKRGLVNWNGDVVIPPVATTYIDGSDLHLWFENKAFKAKELRQVTTEEQCKRTKIFCPKVDVKKKRAIGYDMTGKVIIPEQKFQNYAHFFKKNMKKYIIPYLMNDKQNLRAYQEKVYAPYYNFLSRMEACAKKITMPVGRAYNLVDEITGKNVRKGNTVAQRRTTSSKGKGTSRQVATKKNNAVKQMQEDAMFFDLKGHVKSCVVKEDGKLTTTIRFSQMGLLDFYKEEYNDVNYFNRALNYKDGMGIWYDESDYGDRRISFGKIWQENEEGLRIAINKDGQLTAKGPILKGDNILNIFVVTTYEYNAKGLITQERGGFSDRHYTYQTFDKHGNWTKRIVKDKDGKEQGIETRTIIYW